MKLSIENTLDQLPETLFSYTSNNVVSGTNVYPVRNINSFSEEQAIQIGRTGEEQSEILVLSGVSGTQLTTTDNGRYSHNIDTPVYQIHYDQIILKRSTSGTSGTAIPLATTNITPDSLFTEYNDTTGVSTYAYKTQYLNSISGDLSSESDWFTPSGLSFYSLGKLRKRSKDVLYNAHYLSDDTVVDDWINEWVEEMTNAAIKVNKGYAIGTASYTFGTAGYGTITESGFKQASKIEVTWDGNNYVNSIELPMSQYSEKDYFSSVYPRHSWEGNDVFRILPFGSSGTARFSFGKLSTPLVNETDELPLPLRSYTTGCIEYVQYRAMGKDQHEDTGDPHYLRFMAKKNDFVSEMTPRDQTGEHYINFAEELSGGSLIGSDMFGI